MESVCLSVRALKGKPLKLSTPKSVKIQSMAGPQKVKRKVKVGGERVPPVGASAIFLLPEVLNKTRQLWPERFLRPKSNFSRKKDDSVVSHHY